MSNIYLKKISMIGISSLLLFLSFYNYLILSDLPNNTLSAMDSINNFQEFSKPTISSSLISHGPISIIFDSDFISLGCSGSGTQEDPYLIANYFINSMYTYGIHIQGTTVHFQIVNCYIYGPYTGIDLYSIESSTASIINCTIIGDSSISGSPTYGVYIKSANGVTILNNSINDWSVGITNWSSGLFKSFNNTLENNDDGMIILSSSGVIIESNVFFENSLILQDSYSLTITQNTFNNCGLVIPTNINPSTVSDNTVNDKEIGIFEGESNVTIDSNNYGQLLIRNCYNITINNQILCNLKGTASVAIYTSELIEIFNSSLHYSKWGILVHDSNNIVVNNCSFDESYWGMAVFENCEDILVKENIFLKNNIGIYGAYMSYVTITNNTFHENEIYAIKLSSSSSSCLIYKNIFIDNNQLKEVVNSFSQAYDIGTQNRWYSTSLLIGNIWTDYYKGDGYTLDGPILNRDRYPKIFDQDEDSMPDYWESEIGLDNTIDDSLDDPDNDSLTNYCEFLNDTNPLDFDSDDDQLSDFQELVIFLTDPLDPDSDDDQLLDGEEVLIYDTNPFSSDSDQDGLTDYEEIKQYLTNPNSADSDGDGKTDFFEVNNGFDPNKYNVFIFGILLWQFLLYLFIGIVIAGLVVLVIIIMKRIRKKRSSKIESSLNLALDEIKTKLTETKDHVEKIEVSSISLNLETLLSKFSLLIALLVDKLESFMNKFDTDVLEKSNKNNHLAVKITSIISEVMILYANIIGLDEINNLRALVVRTIKDNISNFTSVQDFDRFYTSEIKEGLYSNLEHFRSLNISFNSINSSDFGKVFSQSNMKLNDLQKTVKANHVSLKNVSNFIDNLKDEIRLVCFDINTQKQKLTELRKILTNFGSISVSELNDLLEFSSIESLTIWLDKNRNELNFRIDGNEVIFIEESDSVSRDEVLRAIDDLLNKYELWEEEGTGKKQG